MSTHEEADHDEHDDERRDRVGDAPRLQARDEPDHRELQGPPDADGDSADGHRDAGLEARGGLPSLGDGTATPLAGIVSLTQSYQGPLPAPADFAAFDQVLPGAADRILAMAEQRQAAEIANQRTTTKSEALAFTGAAWAVSFFPWALAGLTAGLLVVHQPAAAAITGIVTAGAAGPQIIAAARPNKSK